jgi:hypothetical protein
MSNIELIGIIKSDNIKYGKKFGFALAITSTKIVGAEINPSEEPYAVFLDPKSSATPGGRNVADEIAKEIEGKKSFELNKDSILKIMIDPHEEKDGMDGILTFATKEKVIQLTLRKVLSKHPGLTENEAKVLVNSLLAFAPDRFYDIEDNLISDDEKPTPPVEVQKPADLAAPIYLVKRGLWTYSFYWDHFTKKGPGSALASLPLGDIEKAELHLGIDFEYHGADTSREFVVLKIKGEKQELFLTNPVDKEGKASLFEWLSARNVKTIDTLPDESPSGEIKEIESKGKVDESAKSK